MARAIQKHGLGRGSLELELTESMLVRDANGVARKLARLRHAGIRLAIDDFGTGYSSLAYLRHLPVDTLKLDRHFVRDIGDGRGGGAAVVRAVVTLGRELGLTTLAEGVETPEQLAFLRSVQCDAVQGFLLGRPVAAAALETALKTRRALRVA